jgi:hypothetical protein
MLERATLVNMICAVLEERGHGTFRGGEGSNPFVGVQGNLHQETEIRLETIFPAHISSSLTKAIVDNHPYEEPVYDIYNL